MGTQDAAGQHLSPWGAHRPWCPPVVTPPPTPFPLQDVAEEYNRLKDLKRVSVRSAAGLSFQLKWDWVGAM